MAGVGASSQLCPPLPGGGIPTASLPPRCPQLRLVMPAATLQGWATRVCTGGARGVQGPREGQAHLPRSWGFPLQGLPRGWKATHLPLGLPGRGQRKPDPAPAPSERKHRAGHVAPVPFGVENRLPLHWETPAPCMHVCTWPCACVLMSACICAHIFTQVCMSACARLHVHACVCVRTHMCVPFLQESDELLSFPQHTCTPGHAGACSHPDLFTDANTCMEAGPRGGDGQADCTPRSRFGVPWCGVLAGGAGGREEAMAAWLPVSPRLAPGLLSAEVNKNYTV